MTLAEIKTYTTSKLGITDSAALAMAELFAKQRWRVIWNEYDWRIARYSETKAISANSTDDITLDQHFDTIKAVRWAETYDLEAISDISALQLDPMGYSQIGQPVAFIRVGKPAGNTNPTIRLLKYPSTAGNILVIGKRKAIELSTSADDVDNCTIVPIPGGAECLCEFVMADLCEWLRQYDAATRYMQKAGILLDKMKEIESAQSTEIRRIVPYVQQLEDVDGRFDSLRPLG